MSNTTTHGTPPGSPHLRRDSGGTGRVEGGQRGEDLAAEGDGHERAGGEAECGDDLRAASEPPCVCVRTAVCLRTNCGVSIEGKPPRVILTLRAGAQGRRPGTAVRYRDFEQANPRGPPDRTEGPA